MYHVYLNRAAGVYLLLYFFNFLSLKFQNIKFFVTLFFEAYIVETWYTHGQRVDLLRTPNTSSQKILVPLFLFFFLSFQLAKIKNLLLQNCFNIPLMATARGIWALLTLCYIFMSDSFSWYSRGNHSHENKSPQKFNTSIIANETSQRHAKVNRYELIFHWLNAKINSRKNK